VQEQEKNLQPEDIAKCKGDFTSALNALKRSLAPQPKVKKKAAAAPVPAVEKKYENYTVMFDHVSAAITKGEAKAINKAVLSVDTTAAKTVIISGYADRPGNVEYNMMLSGKQANAAAALLDDNSSSDLGGHMQVKVYGERNNKVLTADGKRKPKNRRVKIKIIR